MSLNIPIYLLSEYLRKAEERVPYVRAAMNPTNYLTPDIIKNPSVMLCHKTTRANLQSEDSVSLPAGADGPTPHKGILALQRQEDVNNEQRYDCTVQFSI